MLRFKTACVGNLPVRVAFFIIKPECLYHSFVNYAEVLKMKNIGAKIKLKTIDRTHYSIVIKLNRQKQDVMNLKNSLKECLL